MRRFIILLAACGGGGSGLPGDAPMAPVDSPNNPSCLVSANFGDVGTKTGTTSLGPTTATIVLDAGPPRDSFFIKLVDGKGVFTGGLANGTYTIAGAELVQGNCGLCVNLLADIGSGGPAKFYFATAGSVTLTSTSPPAGSLSNVTLRETDANGNPQGTCTTAISAMQFSVP